ncbi:MAG: ATP-dependent Clp protease proteolytic subunit [Bacteroidetes bacterium]|nr:ATP-dependent Clp protease proteolytic subunit [Bacteroidota bacterium]
MKRRFYIAAHLARTTVIFTPCIKAEQKKTETVVHISGHIGVEGKTDSETFRQTVDALLAKGVKAITLRINSEGGSCFDANEMVSELERFDKVNIKLGALAASAATFFCTKFHTTARKNTQLMIHKPSTLAWGNESDIESTLQLLKNITADYKAAYAAKMGKTEDEVEEMWAKGDKWLTAKEAKDLGLVDVLEGEEPIDASIAALLKKAGAPQALINTRKQLSKKIMDRDELIASLGLAADATDEQINTAIAEMKLAKEAQDKAAKDKGAETEATGKALFLKAVSEKKCTADMEASFLQLHKASPEAAKQWIEKLPSVPKLSDELNAKGDPSVDAARKDWALDDYLENDPKAYEAMKKSDPEKAKRLEEAYFNKKD